MTSIALEQQDERNKDLKEKKDKEKRRLVVLLLFFFVIFFLYTLASLGDFGLFNRGPKIAIDPTYWDKEALVDVVRDATSKSGIKTYQYCITDKTNAKDCEWHNLADKKLPLYDSGKYYIYYRAISNDGSISNVSNRVTALIDNVNPVINSFTFNEITDHTISISLDLFDSLSGIDSITYQIDAQEPVISTDSSFVFNDLKANTTYTITIVVYDKVANKTTLTIPIRTMSEGFDKRNQCFDDDVVEPKITIEPDNEWWSVYKVVTVDFGDNSCLHEISFDLGETWQEYTGPIVYTKDGYITARSTNRETNKSIESTADPRVKYIDPTVPKIGLDDVPSSFEYGEKYKLPSTVAFGRSEGKYECFVDGKKEGGTQLLKVGKHQIVCSAYGNNGLTTTITKDIEVLYRTGTNKTWDGWITLTLEYPPESIDRQWKLYDPNVLVTPDQSDYYWQDYTGPITVRVSDVDKIMIAYTINGQRITAMYSSTDLWVDIHPEKSAIYPDETTKVYLGYPSVCTSKTYRLNGGNWENYTGVLTVGPNTVIEAKCEQVVVVTDSQGDQVTKVNTGYGSTLIRKLNYYSPDNENMDPDILAKFKIIPDQNPIDHDTTTEVEIQGTSAFQMVEYRIYNRTIPGLVGSWTTYDGNKFEVYDDSIIEAVGYSLVNGTYRPITLTEYVGTIPKHVPGQPDYVPMFNLLPIKIDIDMNPCEYGKTTKARIIYNSAITDRVYYSVNGKDYREFTGDFTVEPGDTISAYVESDDPNYYTAYDFAVVQGFSPTYTDIVPAPAITFAVQPDKRVKVTITPPAGASYICYELGLQDSRKAQFSRCSWTKEYIEPFIVSQGTYVSAQYIRQSDGRVSQVKLNARAPIVYEPYVPGETKHQPEVYIYADNNGADNASFTSNSVTVKLESRYASSVQYSFDGIHYMNYTGPFTVTENCKIYAYASNPNGKAYDTYIITFLSNTPSPNVPINNSQLSIDYFPTNAHLIPTIKSVDITITYDDDMDEKLYRIGSSGEWKEYTGPFTITENTVIYAYEKGSAGVSDTQKIINFFANGSIDPVITSDPDNSILSSVDTITIVYDQNATATYYQIDNGVMKEYTGPFDVTENCVITAVQTNDKGQLTYSTYNVTNIGSGGGVSPTNPTNSTIVTFDFHYPAGAYNKKYMNDQEGIWRTYTGAVALMTIDDYNSLYNPTNNTLIYCKSPGNCRDYINDYFIYNGDITTYSGNFTIKYDTVKNNPPVIIPDSTEYYVTKVGIEIFYDPNLITNEYKIKYNNGLETSWMSYNGKFYIDTNNVTIYARGKDSNSTFTTVAQKYIDNVRVQGHVIVQPDYQSLTAYLTEYNPNREIDYYEFCVNGTTCEISNDSQYTFTGLSMNTSYVVSIKAVDIDGKANTFYTTTRTKNMTQPTFTADPATDEWSVDKTITVNYHDEYYDDIELDKYYSIDGGATWIPYVDPVKIHSNMTFMAKAEQRGNPSTYITSSTTISKIDTSAPTITSVVVKEESARLTVDALATDSESGVRYYYYSIDGINYTKTPATENSFTNLKMNTNYNIYVKAENYAGVVSEPFVVTPQTKIIEKPVFKYLESVNDRGNVIDSDWGWEKLVHVRVPYNDQDTIVYYSTDNGTTWIDAAVTTVTMNVPRIPDPEYLFEYDSNGNLTGSIKVFSQDGYTILGEGTNTFVDQTGVEWSVNNDGNGNVSFTFVGPGNNDPDMRTFADFDVTLNQENQTVFVKVVSGDHNEVVSSFTTHLIDRTEPIINYDNLPRVLEMADDSYIIPNFFWVDNNKSGGDFSCTVNGDPIDNWSNTGILRTGYQHIVCTAETGAGHKVDFEHTLPVYSSLKIEAESIVQGIRDAQGLTENALDGGDYTLIIPDENGNEHRYPIELYNYDSKHLTTNETFCDNVPDFKICVLKFFGDLTIDSGVTLQPAARKLGFFVFVDGKLTNNGTISADGKGAQADPDNVLLWKNDPTYFEYVPAVSSAIGGGAVQRNSSGTTNGLNGGTGFFRETGAGGSGSVRGTSTGYVRSGKGAAGSGFGGGAGGGSAVTSGNATTYSQSNILTGGAGNTNGIGGDAVLTWISTNYYAGGGAGAVSGKNKHYANNSTIQNVNVADSKSGGLMILYANEYANNGTVTARGLAPYTYTGSYSANGGSAGGGTINVFYKNLINRGTTNITGGPAAGSPAGGAGGSGTITYSKILSDYDLLGTRNNPYQITTAQELLEVTQHNNDYRDAYYELVNDIDMNGANLNISGVGFEFSGHFNGQGHTISNFKATNGLFTKVYRGEIYDLNIDHATITATTQDAGILAGSVTDNSNIHNINITNSTITGTTNVGGAIGRVSVTKDVSIKDIVVDNTTITGTTNTGGVIGYVENPSKLLLDLDNLVVGTTSFKSLSQAGLLGAQPKTTVKINGGTKTGGLVGYMLNSGMGSINLTYSSFDGTITANNTNTGGLIGHVSSTDKDGHIEINMTYTNANITSTSNYVGGFIGYSSTDDLDADYVYINRSYSAGSVKGVNYVGGFIGYANRNRLEDTYSVASTNGAEYIGSYIGQANNTAITRSYAIGEIVHSGTNNYGAFVGVAVGSTSTDSYFSTETNKVQRTALGINRRIQNLLKMDWYTNYDFANTWAIQATTTAYLRGLPIPDMAYIDNIPYYVLDGDGTQNNPYIVHNRDEFLEIKNELTAYYKQANDFDCGNSELIVKTEVKAPFTGYYSGEGYSITGIVNSSTANRSSAIFNYADSAIVENVTFDAQITGADDTALLFGYAKNEIDLENITINGAITGNNNVGALIGYYLNDNELRNTYKPDGLIKNITVNADVTGNTKVGGLIGYTYLYQGQDPVTKVMVTNQGNLDIQNVDIKSNKVKGAYYVGGAIGHAYSITDGDITLDNVNNYSSVESTTNGAYGTGGIIGYLQNVQTGDISINNSRNKGPVTGTQAVGGIVGYMHTQFTGAANIYRTYSTGAVTGTGVNVGGLIGRSYNQNSRYANFIRESYSTGAVSGTDYVGGLVGGNGTSAAYLTVTDSFTLSPVSGTTYVGSLFGYQNYIKVSQAYAVGKNNSTAAQVHALTPAVANSTNNNVYFSSQTIGIVRTQYGTNLKIWKLERKRFINGFDWDNVWTVEEGETLPYLQHVDKPDDVNDPNIIYHRMDGHGTDEDPYLIRDIEDFNDIRHDVAGVYKFVDDVDGDDAPLVPLTFTHLSEAVTSSLNATVRPETITFNNNETVVFTGKLIGDGHTVRNIDISSANTTFGGLIPYCNNIYVSDLTFENVKVGGTHNTGLICGYNSGDLTLINVDAKDTVVKTTGNSYSVGGYIGYQYSPTGAYISITDSDVDNLTINGYQNVGGLVGYIHAINDNMTFTDNNVNLTMNTTNVSGGLFGRIQNHSGSATSVLLEDNTTSGSITGTDTYIGGQLGYYYNNITGGTFTIRNSTNNATVKGNRSGGIVGEIYNESTTNAVIQNVTNNGELIKYSNSNYYGGIIGVINNRVTGNVTITQANNTAPITGYSYTGGIVGQAYNYAAGDIYIMKSANTAKVIGYDFVGGIAGDTYNNVNNATQHINETYSSGDVEGHSVVGGLIGRVYGRLANSIQIQETYSSGAVTGSANTGGLIGTMQYALLENSYSIGELSGNAGLVSSSSYSTINHTYEASHMNSSANGSLTGTVSNTTTNDSYYVSELSKVIRAVSGTNLKMWQAVDTSYYKDFDFDEIWTHDSNETPYLRKLPKAVKEYDASELIVLDGDGSEENPYLIHNKEELEYVRYELDANYKIVEDIDLDNNFENIGETNICFTGYLDGDNHTISNLNSTMGLFVCTKDAKLENMTLSDFNYTETSGTGLLIGTINDGLEINNIHINGSINNSKTGTKSNIGAIGGILTNANITGHDISFTGDIVSKSPNNNHIGGLFGTATNTSIDLDKVRIDGDIDVTASSYIGGVIGNIDTTSKFKINDYIHNGNITAAAGNYVGGVIGYGNAVEASITNATYTGNITSAQNTGGVAGYIAGSLNLESYNRNGDVIGTGTNIAGVAGTYTRNIDSVYNSNVKDVTLRGNVTGTTYTAGVYGNLTSSVAGRVNVDNLDIESNVTGTSYVGGLFGKALNSNIGNIEVVNSTQNTTITANSSYVGNIVGHLESSNAGQIKLLNNNITYSNIETNSTYAGAIAGYMKLGGNGYIDIDGLPVSHVSVKGTDYIGGLFGYILNSSTSGAINISNIGVEADVEGRDYVGGLVGKQEGTSSGSIVLSNIYHIGDTTGDNHIGGFVGQMIQNGAGTNHIDFGYSDGTVTANTSYAGGLVGDMSSNNANAYMALTRVYADGNVIADTYAGGLVSTMVRGIINNAFNLAKVEAEDYLGGVAYSTNTTTINDVYTIGRIKSRGRNIGGFVGTSTLSVATDSYFSADTTLVNKTALGMNLAFETMLTKDPAYREWNWESIWDIDYEETTAYLQGLPKPNGVNRGANEYSIMAGSGTEEDPYVIMNQFDLSRVNVNADKYFVLGTDVIVADTFTIYPQSNTGNVFTGTLDGQGHYIKDLVIDTDLDDLGLFGVAENATFKNIEFVDPKYINHMSTAEDVGTLVGEVRGNTVIDNITISGAKFETLGNNIGGVVGKVTGPNNTINNVNTSDIEVNGTNNIGGIVGLFENNTNSTSSITNSHANATTNSLGNNIGGIAGKLDNTSTGKITIDKTYSTGDINAEGDYVGGLVGYADNTSTGDIKLDQVYSDVNVAGRDYVGGLIGGSNNIDVTNAYVLGSVSGNIQAGFIGEAKKSSFNHTYTFTHISGYENTAMIGRYVSVDDNSTYNDCYSSSDKIVISRNDISTDLSIDEFLTGSSFTNYDFDNIWKIEEGSTTPYFKNVNRPDFDMNYLGADYTHTVETLYDFMMLDSVRFDGYYRVIVKNQTGTEEHYINLKVFNGDTTLTEDLVLGNKYDVATDAKEAQNSVGFKVNGDLTIDSGVTIDAYHTEYGGPKGMLSCVTGTLNNNGTINMSKRGAKATGQDVYLFRMPNGFIETVPKVGAAGANPTTSSNSYSAGAKGNDGVNRQTAGGGSGGTSSGDSGPRLYSGAGGTGTSYSGGSGGGGIDINWKGNTYYGNNGSNVGGAGGAGYAARYSSSWIVRYAGGGAGNPGAKGGQLGTGNDASSKGEDGTGGLYVLFCNTFNNNGKIEANGAVGGNQRASGGSSGGGSINILCENINTVGTLEANGGAASVSSGSGGPGGNGYTGSTTIDPDAEPAVDLPIITIDTPEWSFTKTVTIDYNSGWDREYSIDNGETWNTYTGPFVVDKSWTTVIARTMAHGKLLESSSFLITMIDEFIPIVELDVDKYYYKGTDIHIPTYEEFNENKSSGSTKCYYDGNDSNIVDNIKDIPIGNHDVTCVATSGAHVPTTVTKNITILETDCLSYKGQSIEFNYTGDAQNFYALCPGEYKIETWGAQGGNSYYQGRANSHTGGKGAYASGLLIIEKQEIETNEPILYAYVGQAGRHAVLYGYTAGSWNGGGSSDWEHEDDESSAPGGGATDFRLVNGAWNDELGLNSRIIVAAGGAGAGSEVNGGAGGTLSSSAICHSAGVTQTMGNAFGIGANGIHRHGNKTPAGAGGGYYGGMSMTSTADYCDTASGGSSFISGYKGAVAITSEDNRTPRNNSNGERCTDENAKNDITCSYHYSGRVFTSGVMAAGERSGNGYAKVTYIGLKTYPPTITVDDPINWSGTKEITISYNPDYDMEYSLDNGETWNEYTGPFTLEENATVTARSSYNGLTVSSATYKETKIYNSKPEVGLDIEDHYYFEVDSVDIPTRYNYNHEENLGNYACWYGDDRTNSILNINEIPAGLWNITCEVSNAYGKIASITKENVAITTYYYNEFTQDSNYSYTGNIQTFNMKYPGEYVLSAWGARGQESHEAPAHGNGGYASGTIMMYHNTDLYIAVGGAGGIGISGYNGGGRGYDGGGGATSITTKNRGVLSNFVNNKDEVLIVAGGAGGGERIIGGAGGGLVGKLGKVNNSQYPFTAGPGTQTSGGNGIAAGGHALSENGTGSFGQGGSGNSSSDAGAGGGGGWYGGGGVTYAGAGGGGSSYIAPLYNAITIDGDSTMPNYNGTGTMVGNNGNGYATIKKIPVISPIIHIDTSKYSFEKTITIEYYENDKMTKEYSLDLGNTWITYTQPFKVNKESVVIARSAYKGNTISSSSMNLFKVIEDCADLENKSIYLDYTGGEQEFNVLCPGVYQIEAWGASGGNGKFASYADIEQGGLGAYTSGKIELTTDDTLYVNIGGRGRDATAANQHTTIAGGYNGGGNGVSGNTDDQAASGGGATDIRLTSGNWDDPTSLRSRIMVAAGGGGGHSYANTNAKARDIFSGAINGHGLSFEGNIGIWNGSSRYTSVTQTSGNAFGIGQSYNNINGTHGAAGGGGGYYGGTTSTTGYGGPGTGGTSYISGHIGAVAVESADSNTPVTVNDTLCANGTTELLCSLHYSGKKFVDTVMIEGNNQMPTPFYTGNSIGRDGNGVVKITFLGDASKLAAIPNIGVNQDSNNSNWKVVTITYDDNFDKEYSIDLGKTWNSYNGPFKIANNATIIARTTQNGTVLTSSSYTVTSFQVDCDSLVGTSFDYDYTGGEQLMIPACEGTYEIELWGASGKTTNLLSDTGLGAYTFGQIDLKANKELYVYVGEAGNVTSTNYDQNTFNGGGQATLYDEVFDPTKYGRGGGATDIRLVNGSWNDFESLKSRIMVAGGGASSTINDTTTGAHAGGLTSYLGGGSASATNATQTSGYKFGIGGPGGYSGAGGGYYGGVSSTTAPYDNTAGGSSYISGHNGSIAISKNSTETNVVAASDSKHYSGLIFENTKMIDGAGYQWTTTVGNKVGQKQPDGSTADGHLGNGYARITYVFNPNSSQIDASNLGYSSQFTSCTDVDCALNELKDKLS